MQTPYTWKLSVRSLFIGQSIFKAKRINQQQIIFHLPKNKEIVTSNLRLVDQQKRYKFSNQMNAIEYMHIHGQPHILAGLKNGQIQIKHAQSSTTTLILPVADSTVTEHLSNINDILDLGDGRIANCYNNGTISLWNLHQTQPLLYSLPKVHQNFVYKLRRMDSKTLLSCGYDCSATITDIEKQIVVDWMLHPQAVWCAYPLSDHCIASVGLFRQALFWDIRTRGIVQQTELMGHQSSFITRYDDNNVVLGDGQNIIRIDLRMQTREVMSNVPMLESVEGILITELGGIAFGRGCDVNCYVNTNQDVIPVQYFTVPNQQRLNVLGFQDDLEVEEDEEWLSDGEGEEDGNEEGQEWQEGQYNYNQLEPMQEEQPVHVETPQEQPNDDDDEDDDDDWQDIDDDSPE